MTKITEHNGHQGYWENCPPHDREFVRMSPEEVKEYHESWRLGDELEAESI